jgi:hypothetical protein
MTSASALWCTDHRRSDAGRALVPVRRCPLRDSRACSTCQNIDATPTSATSRCERIGIMPVAKNQPLNQRHPPLDKLRGTGLSTSQVTTSCLLTAQCLHHAALVLPLPWLAMIHSHVRRCTNGLRCGTNSGPASLVPLLRMSTSCPAWRNMKRMASTWIAAREWPCWMCHAV